MKHFMIAILLIFGTVIAQNENIFPVTINEKMPELTLTSANGENININKIENDNILLIFPRGKVTEKTWCPICHYQYLETIMIQEKEKLFRHNFLFCLTVLTLCNHGSMPFQIVYKLLRTGKIPMVIIVTMQM